MNKTLLLVLMALVCNLILSCHVGEPISFGEANTKAELANQLGDVMASIDEAGRGTTAIAQFSPTSLDGLKSSQIKNIVYENVMSVLFPQANAATCNTAEFSACSANSITRNFNGCSIGGYILSGSVAMTWTGGSSCALTGVSQAIRITPNYTVAGNNISLTATNTGTYGVTLTWASGSGTTKVFQYTNDGINRTLSSNGTALLSISTRTTSPITVTGTTRGSRVLSSAVGALEILNNTSGESCAFQPSSLSWGATNCNCANSGEWIGSCSTTGSFIMTITSCGVASLAYSESGVAKTQTVSLDRCVQN
ncbi:MAG: hypothetical protein V4654_02365 [Bdellovibrionota bacterium]